jgi:heme A synthase
MPEPEIASAVSIPVRPRARWFAPYAWAVAVYNVAVVLWGALVRLTGSGAGCGNHWPLCNGTVTPLSGSAATAIEFTHRLMSGLDAFLVLGLVVWAFRKFPRRHPARLGAALAGVFLITEVLLGAVLVLLQHVGRNPSVNRAYSLSGHLVNTLALLASLALTAWWAGGKPAVRIGGPRAWMAAVSLLAFAILGVSGVIAALGDTLFPAQSLAAGFAQDLDPAASIFLRLRIFHPVIAAVVEAWLVIFAVSSLLRKPSVKPLAWAVLAAAGVQLMAGFVNLALLAPGWMQIVHLLLADTLWILLVLLSASVLAV